MLMFIVKDFLSSENVYLKQSTLNMSLFLPFILVFTLFQTKLSQFLKGKMLFLKHFCV